ncbi:hypothetical protein [Streptomyces lydicus]|uniref:hypothetical protein n=1 Tax=Streptomyces lydicus TaxID=47763 RepID=UPI0037A625BC
MLDPSLHDRDPASLALPEIGRLAETDDPWSPYRLVDPAGNVVEPVALYFDPDPLMRSAGSRSAWRSCRGKRYGE